MQRFYLAGGTALALQLGHRYSIDLDFFSEVDDLSDASRNEISVALSQHFTLDIDPGGMGHMQIDIQTNPVAFMSYGYPLLAPTWSLEGIQLANLLDIGLMKIDAIAVGAVAKIFMISTLLPNTSHLNKSLSEAKTNIPLFVILR